MSEVQMGIHAVSVGLWLVFSQFKTGLEKTSLD